MARTVDDRDVESRITQLLQSTEDDRAQAFELIHQHFRHALCGAARRHNGRIDLEELWGCTMAWFCSHSQGLSYDISNSPIPLLHRFIVRRAIDERRRSVNLESILQELARRLGGTRTGVWWLELSVLERQETLSELERTIASLPARQRQVWRVYVHNFPETQRMARLRELVEKQQGTKVSLASVERALQEGRKKIRAMFANKGYSGR